MFILPSSLFSVLLLISLLSYQLVQLIDQWIQRYLSFKAVNWDFSELKWFNFEFFFINTDATVIIGLLGFAIAIGIIYIAKEISNHNEPLILSYACFLAGYWILYALWWSAAIVQILRGKKVRWGHKSEDTR